MFFFISLKERRFDVYYALRGVSDDDSFRGRRDLTSVVFLCGRLLLLDRKDIRLCFGLRNDFASEIYFIKCLYQCPRWHFVPPLKQEPVIGPGGGGGVGGRAGRAGGTGDHSLLTIMYFSRAVLWKAIGDEGQTLLLVFMAMI